MKLLKEAWRKEGRKKIKQLLHYETWCQIFLLLFQLLILFFCLPLSTLETEITSLSCRKMNIVGKSSRVWFSYAFCLAFANPSPQWIPPLITCYANERTSSGNDQITLDEIITATFSFSHFAACRDSTFIVLRRFTKWHLHRHSRLHKVGSLL